MMRASIRETGSTGLGTVTAWTCGDTSKYTKLQDRGDVRVWMMRRKTFPKLKLCVHTAQNSKLTEYDPEKF